jgi:IS30 family transposase
MWNKYKKYLRCWFKWYRKKKTNYSKSRILNRIWIEIRDSISNINNEKWHFEADLIVSKKWFKSVLLTLIDRKTRFPRIYKLKDKTSENIMKKIVKIKKTLGIKSVTFDNWMEFAKHYYLNKRWINTYFSDPYSPWQKWQIENLNRRVRIFYPKWTNFDEVKKSEIKSVVKILTHTPREILSFNTPYQEHFQ